MSGTRYMISDASKKLDIEPHVLRYWEDELDLNIPRNELGHRYYREDDIKLLEDIKDLKNKGFQLKAIKMIIFNVSETKVNKNEGQHINQNQIINKTSSKYNIENNSTDKITQFKLLMREMFEDVLKENNYLITESLSEQIIKQMNYLFRVKEENEEERYKKLDETIRGFQKMRQEVAVTKKSKKIRNIFKKNKK